MAYDLVTLSNATYAASSNAAFGQALAAGYGLTSGPVVAALPCTIEAWVTTTSTATGKRVAAGQYLVGWIGCNGANASASYGSSNIEIPTTIAINDGQRHHLELVLDTASARFYVDGVLAGSATASYTFDFTGRKFGIRGLNFSGGSTAITNDWAGTIDEVAAWTLARHSANFTLPTAPIANSSSGLRALYHFESNGLDSASPTADTTAPTISAAAVANSMPAVVAMTASENLDGAFLPAASDFTVGGHTVQSVAISGTVINLNVTAAFVNGEAAREVSYTKPASNGARDVAGNLLESFSGLAVTNNVSGSGDTNPPAFVNAQVTNSQPAVILVTMNETLANSVPPNSAFTPSGGRTATSVSISGTVASVTVNTPYTSSDTITIAYTQPGANPRLQDAAGNPAATFAAQPVTNNIGSSSSAYDSTKILFSPYNWDVSSTRAKSVNAGAYFRTIFGGATCTLIFDVSAALTPYTKLSYRVDGTGPWITVDLAASVPITVPSETSGYGSHLLEVRIKAMAMNDANPIWPATSAVAVILTGVTLAAGKSLTLPPARPLRALVYGDSITVGYRSLNGGESTTSSDASQTGAFVACEALNAEIGVVAFSGHGWLDTGYGGVPGMTSTYNQLWNGQPRSFAQAPDFILINQGTNDGVDITTAVSTVLNGLLAATPVTTKIILLCPYGSSRGPQITAGIAATTAPARCTFVDTTGWFRTYNAFDSLHPYGIEHVTRLAPLTADSVRTALAAGPALTTRTVSLTLGEAAGVAANLTGLQVSFYDEPTPDLHSVPRFRASNETTDAFGVLTFAVESTLPTGGAGNLVVQMADGRNLVRTVTVV